MYLSCLFNCLSFCVCNPSLPLLLLLSTSWLACIFASGNICSMSCFFTYALCLWTFHCISNQLTCCWYSCLLHVTWFCMASNYSRWNETVVILIGLRRWQLNPLGSEVECLTLIPLKWTSSVMIMQHLAAVWKNGVCVYCVLFVLLCVSFVNGVCMEISDMISIMQK